MEKVNLISESVLQLSETSVEKVIGSRKTLGFLSAPAVKAARQNIGARSQCGVRRGRGRCRRCRRLRDNRPPGGPRASSQQPFKSERLLNLASQRPDPERAGVIFGPLIRLPIG